MYKLNRKSNTIKSTTTGLIVQTISLLVPFFIRTVFIRTLGLEYNGLNSLFVSIMQVLNLAELGVGYALVFSMYKSVAENDVHKTCALMALYRTYYRIIGCAILLIGLLITPFIPHLVKGDIPSGINIYIVYYLNLSVTVFSYFLFAYKNSILTAYQKDYISNIIILFINICKYLLQLVVLIRFRDFYAYLLVCLFFQPIQNIVIAIAAHKCYPQYSPKGHLSKAERNEINRKVFNLFAAKVCGVVTNSAASLVISSVLGLYVLGKYNNYYFILSSVMALYGVFFNSIRAGLGNALLTETNHKNVSDFKKLTVFVFLLICICFSCLLNLCQPFVELWVGRESLLDQSSCVLLSFYFLFFQFSVFLAVYKDAAGKWKEDLVRSIVSLMFNLIMTIIMVKSIGLNGVLLSPVFTYALISGPWLLVILKKHVMDFDIKEYVFSMFQYVGCTLASGFLSFLICRSIKADGIVSIIVYLAISLLISTSLFIIIFRNKKEFEEIRLDIKQMITSKFF